MEKEEGKKEAIFDNVSLEININIATIEKAKGQFFLNLNAYSKQELIENLKNLLGLIESFLYKYLTEEEIREIKIKGYDFFQTKEAVNLLENLDINQARNVAREILIISYAILNKVLYRLRVAIPVVKKNFKKKIINDFYDLINVKNYGFENFEDFENALLNEYQQKIKELHLADKRINFLAFAYSKLKFYDLDGFTIITGFPRAGKSTLALDLTRRIFAFWLNTNLREATKYAREKWLWDYVYYIPSHFDFSRKYEKTREKIFLLDEGYFAGDKRLSMNPEQIKATESINAYANRNHIVFFIIQFSEDLDFRIFKRALAWIHCYERGKALIFTREKSFSFKEDVFNVQKVLKANINTKEMFEYLLKKRATGILTWKKLNSREEKIDFDKEIINIKLGYPIKHKLYYDIYLILKNYYQNLYTSQKEKEQIDKMKEFEIIEKLKAKMQKDKVDFDTLVNELVAKGISKKLATKLVNKAKEKIEFEALNV
jgi:hypothetical protein